MNYTEILSAYAARLRYDDLPPEVVARARQLTLHVLGVSLASLPMEQATKVTTMVQSKGGVPEATVWGSDGGKVPADEAALANGTLADLLDWEDCSWTGHPSAGAIPVALAMGEKLDSSGTDYLTSVVAAFEVYQRIAMAVQPTRERWGSGRGWGLVSWQVYAPVVAAAKLMGLDADGVVKALGAAYYQVIMTAGKHTGGAGVGASDIYHYAHGFCNRNGICAAQMAELGFDGMTDSLDGPDGLWAQVSDRVDWSWHDRELGSRYLILETLLKHWPANMWIQGPLDALDALCREHDLGPDRVDRIAEIVVSPTIPMIMENPIGRYDGVLDAQFHLPYCFAAYLLDREAGQHWFDAHHRSDPAIHRLADRVTSAGRSLTPFEAFEIFWTGSFPLVGVTITLDDGRTLARRLRYPKGHPRNPFTWDETERLFRHAVADVLDEAATERIIELVGDLEAQPDLHELARLLTVRAS